jgi:TonB family protein
MTGTELLVASAWKATLILAAAFLINAALPRASAATRHFVWTVSLVTVALLPLALRFTPEWTVPTASTFSVEAVAPAFLAPVSTTLSAAQAPAPIPWLLLAWAAGVTLTAAWTALGAWRVRRIVHAGKSTEFAGDFSIPVLISPPSPVPMACGIWKPAVVLPPVARNWPPERLQAVIAHEVAHIQRGDLWALAIGHVACCLYWFHPLAWLAARQLRIERERACDDAVLIGGIAAPDYATHLMELARGLRRPRIPSAAMADLSGLEARVRALLDSKRNHRPMSPRAAFATVAAFLAILLPAAAVHAQQPAAPAPPPSPAQHPVAAVENAPAPVKQRRARPVLIAQAQAAPAPVPPSPAGTAIISGVVQDSSSARIPNCSIAVTSPSGVESGQLVVQTNPVGAYQLPALPAGRYVVEFRVPGFALARREVTLTEGQQATVNVTLTVGSVQEAVTVVGKRSAAAPAPAGAQRVRVGGNVQAARLIAQSTPVYPQELQQEGITGSVVIKAGISTTGEPVTLQVISSPDSRLTRAAVEAVQQWRYSPTLLNGEPIPIETQVTVDFRLDP